MFLKRIYFILIPLILLILSIQFNYVDGDEAYTIIHHVIGDVAIQKEYGVYAPAFNKILDVCAFVFNKNETALRTIAFLVMTLSSLLFIFVLHSFFLRLIQLFNIKITQRSVDIYCCLLPFIVPELIFYGLFFNSSLISIVLLLISLNLLIKYLIDAKTPHYILSIILFGIACSFRWDSALFIAFMLTIILTYQIKQKNIQWQKLFITGILYISSFLIFSFFIYNKGLTELMNYISVGKKFQSENLSFSWLVNIATGLSLFTPAILLLIVTGIIKLTRSNHIMLLGTCLVLSVPLLYIHLNEILNPKRIIIIVPALLFIGLCGFDTLVQQPRRMGKILLLLFIITPWIIGIKVNSKQSAWGPAFGYKNPETVTSTDESKHIDDKYNLHTLQITPTFIHGGMALPTSEGHRPLYGYSAVLLGGKWKDFHARREEERQTLLASLPLNRKIIIQETNAVLLASCILREGFKTSEGWDGVAYNNDKILRKRDYYNNNALVRFVFPAFNMHQEVTKGQYISQIFETEQVDTIGLYYVNPTLLTNTIAGLPENQYQVIPIGINSYVLIRK